MRPVGFDLSTTSTGWAAHAGEVGRIRPKKLAGIERRRWIALEVAKVAHVARTVADPTVLAVIEAVPTHAAYAVLPLGMLHGVVLEALDRTQACIAVVPGPVLKKHLTGRGNAKKEQMVEAARALGYQGTNHDEADAFGLALIGHHLLGGTDHLTPQRSALLASVAWERPLPESAPA